MHTCSNCGKDVEGNIAEPCPKCGFDPLAAGGATKPAGPDAISAPGPEQSSTPNRPLRIPRTTTTGGTVPAPSGVGVLGDLLRRAKDRLSQRAERRDREP